ncbi:MAG: dihydroxyacetone kinase subunit DhaK [Rhizobiales bacterium]|nr:dihydroxyacetone kinase subunit DhaK [Hyphomicrobiales bacterium]
MKKLINDPRHLVRECLEGIADLNADVALLDNENILVARVAEDVSERPVSVISGGGSGHEPAHAGYVGHGMLSAAVAGDVFTSPSVDAVLAAIRSVSGPAGCVLIVKNYTGDRLNFGLAAEIASGEGIPTQVVVVADDVALSQTVPKERRRGLAGTVLIHKLAGAFASQGASVDEVAEFAGSAAAELGTMGVALGACVVPAAGKPGFELAEQEIELGLGIHGEKGVRRVNIQPADAIVGILVSTIVADLQLTEGDVVGVLVNGLGATPPIELAVVARAALANLRQRGIEVDRAWCGTLLSALEMPGVSISLLKLDDRRIEALDQVTDASAWPGRGQVPRERAVVAVPAVERESRAVLPEGPLTPVLVAARDAVAQALLDNEEIFAELYRQAGDGDLGDSMVRGAHAMRELEQAAFATPSTFLMELAQTLRRAIAGSSGPFYAIGLARASRLLEGVEEPGLEHWVKAFEQAVIAIEELGGAKRGDRTMIDALRPALDALNSAGHADGSQTLEAAAAAARAGADATAGLRPSLGRASYLGDRALGVKDGGAEVVAVWLEALSRL